MMQILNEIKRRNPLLYYVGLFHVVLSGMMVIGLFVDTRQVLGINTWIKPLKFALSITLFVWTVAWLLDYLKSRPRAVARISWIIAIAMLVEIACIAGQGFRGVASHFNNKSLYDGIVFSVMGIMILINTGAMIAMLALFLRTELHLPKAYDLAVKLGLFLFVVGSLEGMVMVINKAHTIGMLDGGPGLPWFNWSTRAGDLRISHFLGLHAIQALPIFGWLVANKRNGTALVGGFGAVYLALMVGLFVQATLGYPLIRM